MVSGVFFFLEPCLVFFKSEVSFFLFIYFPPLLSYHTINGSGVILDLKNESSVYMPLTPSLSPPTYRQVASVLYTRRALFFSVGAIIKTFFASLSRSMIFTIVELHINIIVALRNKSAVAARTNHCRLSPYVARPRPRTVQAQQTGRQGSRW